MNTEAKTNRMITFSQEGYKLPEPCEKVGQNSNMVAYGKDNRYSQFLWDLYENCSLFESLVNTTVDYICGDEIVSHINNDLEEIARKCALDLVVFNACAVQRVRNKLGELVAVYYLDQTKIRYASDFSCIYYSDDWSSYTKKYVTIPVNDETAESDCVIFRNTSKSIYPTPMYGGALRSIVILSKITDFHLNNISNGFSASCIINMNNGIPSETEKDAIETMLKKKFGGSENAGKFLVAWNESKDNEATIVKLTDDQFDKKYEALKTASRDDVTTAFRIPAQLIGVATQQTGFSSIEYKNAFELYNKTVIKPLQTKLIKFFGEVYKQENAIEIVPFTLPQLSE